jgi:ATP-dependent Clp protease ATP-binding subunit ClpC
VIDSAVDESRRINQPFVGSEHLLLALLREGSSPAAKILQQHGVTYERARARLYKTLGAP